MKNFIRYCNELLELLGEDKRLVPKLIVIFLLASLLDLVGLGLIGPYISLVIDPQKIKEFDWIVPFLNSSIHQEELLTYLGAGILLVFIFKTFAAIGVTYIIINFSQNQQVRLRSALMKSFQALPYPEYLERNSSEYIDSITRLTNLYTDTLRTGLKLVSDSIVGVAIICLLAWQNAYAITLLLVLLCPFIFIYDRIFRSNLHELGAKSNRASRDIIKATNEGIDGLKEIRILGKEKNFHQTVLEGAREYAHHYTRSQLISISPRYLLETILIGFVIFFIIGTIHFGQNPQTVIPTLGVFGVAAIRLIPTAHSFSSGLIMLRFNREAISKLYIDYIKMKDIPQIKKAEETKRPVQTFKTLQLENLSFSYKGASRYALEDISLKIDAGESIGFIGTSGAGKTTLIDMLLGLLSPSNGKIIYNETPLNKSLEDWRSHVAYLPQQIFLTDGSVWQNITLETKFDHVDKEKLTKALKQARLKEVIENLPFNIDTTLGERGVRLSGGQRQRIALARAFYHERDVLILDEATSSLDNETEKEVVNELQRLKGTKTLIVIAHRLSTVSHCDRIYQLENGHIIKGGTYEEVIS